MLKSGEMSPTLFPTRLFVWCSPATEGDLFADGISVDIGVFGSGLGVEINMPQAIFVQPKTPLEQKQLLQSLSPVSSPDQPLSTVSPPDKVQPFPVAAVGGWAPQSTEVEGISGVILAPMVVSISGVVPSAQATAASNTASPTASRPILGRLNYYSRYTGFKVVPNVGLIVHNGVVG